MSLIRHLKRAMLAGGSLAMAITGQSWAKDLPVSVDGGMLAAATPSTDGIRMFKGIPYAAPPVGARRWRAPQPVTPWKGLRHVETFAPDCMQDINENSPASRPRSEDCLYLNVWTPAPVGADRSQLHKREHGLPVYVWIHGGGSRVGSGAQPTFDGTALAKRGIIVVTINYRLGPFGFLTAPQLSAESGYGGSGDYGFMDDIAALQWVQRNIARFGGDPTRVTIGGESSGSVTGSALMASPLAKGLFAQVIGESGSAMRVPQPGSMGADTLAAQEPRGQALMDKLGAKTLADLRAEPADAILGAAKALSQANFYNIPVVDGHVLPKSPWNAFATGHFNDVPLLVGWNAQEGSLALLFSADHAMAPALTRFYGAMAGYVAPWYATRADLSAADAFVQMQGDNNIAWPTWRWALAQARFGKSPVYVYQFDHAPPVPAEAFGKAVDARRAGSFHGAEIPYAFDTIGAQPGWALRTSDQQMAETMSGYWANFIRTGSPQGEDASGKALPAWPRYTPGADAMRMQLSERSAAVRDPDFHRFMALLAAHEAIDPTQPQPPER